MEGGLLTLGPQLIFKNEALFLNKQSNPSLTRELWLQSIAMQSSVTAPEMASHSLEDLLSALEK